MEIAFSQIPGLDSMSWLSTLATVMSFTYSSIGIGLGVAQIIGTYVSGRVEWILCINLDAYTHLQNNVKLQQ
jgi:hypothetical protein